MGLIRAALGSATGAIADQFKDYFYCESIPADILVVKLKPAKQYLRDYYMIPDGEPCYSESDIMLALKYVMKFCTPFLKPLVICIALGSNMGDHAGNSVLSEYMNLLAGRKSVALVV